MLPCGFCFKTLWLVIQELPLPHGLSAFISDIILVRTKLIYSLFTLSVTFGHVLDVLSFKLPCILRSKKKKSKYQKWQPILHCCKVNSIKHLN